MTASLKESRPSREGQVRSEHELYVWHRVLDALLREDVRGCVSQSAHLPAAALPDGCAGHATMADTWLEIAHFGPDHLWIPVVPAGFMQDWKSAGLPWLRQRGTYTCELHTLEQIIACFAQGLSAEAASLFEAFVAECQLAVAHRTCCESERERWFGAWCASHAGVSGADLAGWHTRLLHYDRLAAFLDHPFYPTARAKLGFDDDALAAYSPEFQKRFQLRWLAVPKALHHPSTAQDGSWPTIWPGMQHVGLPARLAATHVLMPVHPFVWDNQLDTYLGESGLRDQAIRAPRPYLAVAPTLSVRTVVLLDAPEWHLKLPLTMRTLGARNIRTIKPSTIHDGHRIQTLLGAIAQREPLLAGRLLLTDEERGAHVDQRVFLGYILRRYSAAALDDSTLIPVAALMAPTPGGRLVAEEAVERFYGGDADAFLNDYLELTLRLHLLLWLRYGIALESNQQNSVIVFSKQEPRLRLLLKDNDAARIHLDALRQRWPQLARHLDGLHDQRIVVPDPLPLAQMFTTITLQLNIACLVERFAVALERPAAALYTRVRRMIEALLCEWEQAGENVTLARRILLEDERLPIKYLLIAATLADKADTGAADVNKFYGRSAPNFLRPGQA